MKAWWVRLVLSPMVTESSSARTVTLSWTFDSLPSLMFYNNSSKERFRTLIPSPGSTVHLGDSFARGLPLRAWLCYVTDASEPAERYTVRHSPARSSELSYAEWLLPNGQV